MPKYQFVNEITLNGKSVPPAGTKVGIIDVQRWFLPGEVVFGEPMPETSKDTPDVKIIVDGAYTGDVHKYGASQRYDGKASFVIPAYALHLCEGVDCGTVSSSPIVKRLYIFTRDIELQGKDKNTLLNVKKTLFKKGQVIEGAFVSPPMTADADYIQFDFDGLQYQQSASWGNALRPHWGHYLWPAIAGLSSAAIGYIGAKQNKIATAGVFGVLGAGLFMALRKSKE